jgi:hypothetical protein
VDGIESHLFHPEEEDDWLLVHQATDPKRLNLTSFFPKKGKGCKQFIEFWLHPPFSELPYLPLLTSRAYGAASLMVRWATPDVGHPLDALHIYNFPSQACFER